jgi:membrane protein DedA with SNARE-associated domain
MMALTRDVLAFVGAHAAWGPPLAFLLAFGESLAVISLILPTSAILLGVGAIIGAGALDFWSIWLAASLGASVGDWLSYWVGLRWGHGIMQVWPLRRYAAMLPKATRFFERWGIAGVFIGRFLGPLRATVPLAAGIAGMGIIGFQIANVMSALLWAAALLAPGSLGLHWFKS